MNKERIVLWFSCGAASAVATKICLEKYKDHELKIVRIVIPSEHPDNARFAYVCEAWFGYPIINISSDKYTDTWDVWTRKQYLGGPKGAPCTTELKTNVRFKFEKEWKPTMQVFGYTVEEKNRADIFRKNNPSINLITPLIDENLNKSDCLGILKNANIEIPMMYKLGFNNNNCIGCVKAGAGYWNKIRKIFPATYKRMEILERELNHSIIRIDGKNIFLDELAPEQGRHDDPEIDCSLFCYMA